MSKRLYVGNLSWDTTADTLRVAFDEEGDRSIRDVQIATDREASHQRGLDFGELDSETEARGAIRAFDEHALQGRPLRVNEARERPSCPGGDGGRDCW